MLKDSLSYALKRALTGYTATDIHEAHFRKSHVPVSIPRFFSPENRWPLDAQFSDSLPLFITARFRSGSTLLWRLLRSCPSVQAYYEPLNPRKWFCPSSRGQQVDKTHTHVANYWKEYHDIPASQTPWEDDWATNNIYLSPLQPEIKLQRYIKTLLELAAARPILQFNRVDFRLAWLRQCFPDIPILHLYRNPRDQWLSSYQKTSPPTTSSFCNYRTQSSEFYTDSWAEDLSKTVPLLRDFNELHCYEVSFLIWRLSCVFAENTATHSIAYEDLVRDPIKSLASLADILALPELARLPEARTITAKSVERWRHYAADEWFLEKEQNVNKLLETFVFDKSFLCPNI